MSRLLWWLLLLPVQLLLVVLFGAVEVVRLLFLRRVPQPPPVPDTRHCSLVILNWNGRPLLEECIPSVIRAVETDGGDHQILVVDNGSTDDSLAWLRRNHPRVEILELGRNLGFGEGNNAGVRAARHPIVVLLNNDMVVADDFLQPLRAGFTEPEVFAVASQVEFPPGKRREETGYTQGRFELGYLHVAHEPIGPAHLARGYVPVLWAGGGASAYRRDLFLELGGFSSLFSPCYFEDTDLSYRAWRRGWHSLLAVRSRVLHKHRSSTVKRFSQDELRRMVESRRLWYLWRNFQWRTLLGHCLLYPLNMGRWTSPRAWMQALVALPAVVWARLREPARAVSDRELFTWTRHPVLWLNRFHPHRARDSRPAKGLRILVVSAYLPHLGTHGGAGRVFQLLKRVARRHPVDLLTFVEDERDAVFAEQARACCRRVETVVRMGHRPLSWFAYEPFEEFNVPAFRERLEEMLLAEDYDLVHFEWTQSALYEDLVPAGTPRILTEIEVNYAAHRTFEAVAQGRWMRFRRRYNTLQTLYREVELCRRMDEVICVTEEDRSYLADYLPGQRLEVIKTGVDPSFFRFNLGGSRPDTLLFVGAFRHAPNLDAMFFFCREIFPRIRAERPQTHLYIVGSGPPPEIVRLAEDPNITVTGFVEDIRDYYRLAQVVVVPLRTGVGIRGKILEAWSAGRATVATSLAAQGIRARHGENIMIADEPEEFARWTLALLRNPDYCRRLGLRGREEVENLYDWDVLGEQLLELYERAAGWVAPALKVSA